MSLKNPLQNITYWIRTLVLMFLGIFILFFSETHFDIAATHRNILGYSLLFYSGFKIVMRFF